jgi:hypothetical protein
MKEIQTHLIILLKHTLNEAFLLYQHKIKEINTTNNSFNKGNFHMTSNFPFNKVSSILLSGNLSDDDENKNNNNTILNEDDANSDQITSIFLIPSVLNFSFDSKFLSLMSTPWHQVFLSQYSFFFLFLSLFFLHF